MVLNDKRTGDATEQEIDEAQGVMVRAVSAELRARGVTFHQDSLQDWICAGEFRGFETSESLADEWMSYDEEEIDPDAELRAEYYDEYGELVNTLASSDVKLMGGRLLPARTEMIPADKPGHRTVIVHRSLVFDQPIPEGFFTTQNITRVR